MHLEAKLAVGGLALHRLALTPAAAHPLDPLNADDTISAAQILLAGDAASPAPSSRASSCVKPPKTPAVSAPAASAAAAGHGVLPPEPAELQEHGEPERRTFTRPVLIPIAMASSA